MSEPFQHPVPRPSLNDVTPDHEQAAAWLSAAADAYLSGDMNLARQHLSAADIPALYRVGRLLMDRKDPDVAWPRKGRVARGDTIRAKLRMPSPAEMLSIYTRDGWRCRYCGCRVIYARSRDVWRKAFPNEIPWPSTGPMHGGFFALTASADHVVPHSKGGDNAPENLVTACWPCNFGMEGDTLEELGLSDPRLRPPRYGFMGWPGAAARQCCETCQPTQTASHASKICTRLDKKDQTASYAGKLGHTKPLV